MNLLQKNYPDTQLLRKQKPLGFTPTSAPYFGSEQDPEVIIDGKKVLMFDQTATPVSSMTLRIKEAAIEATRKYLARVPDLPFLKRNPDSTSSSKQLLLNI